MQLSSKYSSLISSLKCKASVGHKETQAPQSTHFVKSTNTRPFLLIITLFFSNDSVILFILSSGISINILIPLEPVENFKILKEISYFSISLIIFE